jgi:hypothetical protein
VTEGDNFRSPIKLSGVRCSDFLKTNMHTSEAEVVNLFSGDLIRGDANSTSERGEEPWNAGLETPLKDGDIVTIIIIPLGGG